MNPRAPGPGHPRLTPGTHPPIQTPPRAPGPAHPRLTPGTHPSIQTPPRAPGQPTHGSAGHPPVDTNAASPSIPMTDSAAAECRRTLDAAVRGEVEIESPILTALADLPSGELDAVLREFAAEHGAAALAALTALASDRAERTLRRAAKRSLYRLAQRGIAAPRPAAARPVVEREPERATRAWVSGIDGSGSRAAWIVFEGGFGGAALCSVIVNDTVGILEVAGGDVTKKRLERELAALRASQTLPWVEADPAARRGARPRGPVASRRAGNGAARRVRALAAILRRGGRRRRRPPTAPAPTGGARARGARALGRAARPPRSRRMVPRSRGPPERRRRAAPDAREPARRLRPDQGRAARRRSSTRVVERELTPEARGALGPPAGGDGVDLHRHRPRRAGRGGPPPPPRPCATRRARSAAIRSCSPWPGAGSTWPAR